MRQGAPGDQGRLRVDKLRDEAERLVGYLPPLTVPALRFFASNARGSHGRRRPGSGDSFWQFRPYLSGDEASQIDWRRSARTGSLYVRQNEWETAQNAWLWCDMSGSMRYRSDPALPSKLERAAVMALALTRMLISGGERVGYLGRDERAAGGGFALARMSSTLEGESVRASADDFPAELPGGRSPFLVLIGDFFGEREIFERGLARLAQAGIVGAIMQVVDPAEEDFPFEGRVDFEGPEGEGRELLPRSEDSRANYRQRFAAHEEWLEDRVSHAGWLFIRHRTDHPATTPLLQVIQTIGDPTLTRRAQ